MGHGHGAWALGRAPWPFLPAGSGQGPDAEALLPALLPAHEEVGAAPAQPPGTVAALLERGLWMAPPWWRLPVPDRGAAPWARAAMAWPADGAAAGGGMA